MSARAHYIKGWEAFETGFTDNRIMRELISLAYNVLWQSYEIAKTLQAFFFSMSICPAWYRLWCISPWSICLNVKFDPGAVLARAS